MKNLWFLNDIIKKKKINHSLETVKVYIFDKAFVYRIHKNVITQ